MKGGNLFGIFSLKRDLTDSEYEQSVDLLSMLNQVFISSEKDDERV